MSFVLFVVNFPRLPLPFVPFVLFVLFVVDTPLSVARSAFNVERSPHHSPLTTHHSLLPFVLFVVRFLQRSAFSRLQTCEKRGCFPWMTMKKYKPMAGFCRGYRYSQGLGAWHR